MTINESQDKIIEDFSSLNDWLEKYEYIIDVGKSLEPMDEKYKTEENLISGCLSKVWLWAELKGNKIYFSADSDTVIINGVIALLLRVVNGQSPGDLIESKLYFIDRIGLSSNLSPARSNGLVSIIKRIEFYAKKYLDQIS